MNVATITMDREEARERLASYQALARGKTGEVWIAYQAMIYGLHELARGATLLDLNRAMRDCPVDSKGRPRLAIARSDRKTLQLRTSGSEFVFDSGHDMRGGRRALWVAATETRVDVGRSTWSVPHGYAIVPLVPPEGVKKAHGITGLRYHHTLFEVERWVDDERELRADRDPYLLRHVHGDIYAVLHSWDLSSLERAVMEAAARG